MVGCERIARSGAISNSVLVKVSLQEKTQLVARGWHAVVPSVTVKTNYLINVIITERSKPGNRPEQQNSLRLPQQSRQTLLEIEKKNVSVKLECSESDHLLKFVMELSVSITPSWNKKKITFIGASGTHVKYSLKAFAAIENLVRLSLYIMSRGQLQAFSVLPQNRLAFLSCKVQYSIAKTIFSLFLQ